jgi:hypothetical protein
MTPNLVRVLLSQALLVAGVLTWLEVLIVVERFSSRDTGWWLAGLGAIGVVLPGWLLIWWRAVRWTRYRVLGTVGAFAFADAAAVGVYGSIGGWTFLDPGGLVLGAIAWAGAWFAGTALVWRETAAERAARTVSSDSGGPVCLQCGYSMKGLSEARCPECGRQYTLDELLAAQRPRDSLETR